MLASVIVSTRNRARLLERLLLALAAQAGLEEAWEILVVDDHSTDETPTVCRDWQNRLRNLRVITQGQHGGLGAAANRAVTASRGACLLFTDDDCVPEPNWVRRMTQALGAAPIVAGGIVAPTANYFQLCHNIAQFHPFLVPGPTARRPEFVAGANLGVRREVMAEVGEFDPRTPIPDMEWVLRARAAGLAIAFAGSAAITHDPPRASCREILAYAADHAEHTIALRQRFRELLSTPFVLRSRPLLLAAAPLIALRTAVLIFAGNRCLWRHGHTFPVVFLIKMAWCRGAARGLRPPRGTVVQRA